MSRVAITGGFSYTGRYLAKLLLDGGHSVVSLSRRQAPLAPAPLSPADASKVFPRPMDFSDEVQLGASLEGCDVLFCTYWIRFAMGGDSHDAAADRCARLFNVARQAGVKRVVFTSHTRATEDSPCAYLAGKAKACAALRSAGLPSYAIARPCGIFGDTPGESILMNNAAWVLRRSPLFLLAGDGSHRFQPIHVRDFSELLLELGGFGTSGAGPAAQERDACGPDAPTSVELFSHVARAVGSRSIVRAPGVLSTKMVTTMSKPIDWLTGDILLDKGDLDLLCSGLTVADDPDDPAIAQRRSLLSWLDEVGPNLGKEYISSVDRYYKK
eukprot:CAMPEP_0203889628 /NCGR_PEP_ID=MMETSP0359-20131031/33172_1 /ASSEMBLY_ACC=CAM_ASM_000338 /TAXON_ID=268821 /ORGANISM="Scrippsiella Hangoei, Strain SHTV-5" /LENGTH=326 /DNA_ID=CAMNT_0050811085 /DNA_START=56 /DNA_END=1036 /DNA_ORIENTATION=+